MTFLGVVVFRDDQNTVFFPTAPEWRSNPYRAPPRRAAIAVTYPSIYDPPFRIAAALGGVSTSVIPTTIVLDRSHRPAEVFLREATADDFLDVALPLAEEAPAS